MSTHHEEPEQTPAGQPPGDKVPDNSLTLKEFLETATDATRRTRFTAIVMVVASVLLLVSVLNSWDYGWITLRLAALGDATSEYTLNKFPLLCRCDRLVQDTRESANYCRETLALKPEVKKIYWTFDKTEEELAELKRQLEGLESEARGIPPAAGAPQAVEEIQARRRESDRKIKAKEEELKAAGGRRQAICDEEKKKLSTFHDTLLRGAAETKYMVRVPFFGVALDINDIGFMGGVSLCIILLLLRLSLRSQIVSLRIGFKAAIAAGREESFYDILASRQMFVFPLLKAYDQKADVAGWTERWWQKSRPGKYYYKQSQRVREWLGRRKAGIEARLKAREEGGADFKPDEGKIAREAAKARTAARNSSEAGKGSVAGENAWLVNRHTSLRAVPTLLCLLPFVIYLAQFSFDLISSFYGFNLSTGRTWLLIVVELSCLVAILCFGLWCVTKWNELDKLWDYFYRRVEERKLEARQRGAAVPPGDDASPASPLPPTGA